MFHTQIKFQMSKNSIFSQFRKEFRIQNWFNPEFRKQDSHPSSIVSYCQLDCVHLNKILNIAIELQFFNNCIY